MVIWILVGGGEMIRYDRICLILVDQVYSLGFLWSLGLVWISR